MGTGAKKVNILDCTLRDGSYAIDYQFTAKDTAEICIALQNAGVEYIEIGHGVGFNGSEKHGKAVATDEEYIQAAAGVLKKSKFGMFCIPGIARLEDLDMAASHGMHFVRVGTNVTEVESAEPFVKKAKKLGMFVSLNMMKSYALPVAGVVQQAALARDYGADVIAVVDSAGGMLPEDVRGYVSRIKKEVAGIEVGFHGHNNLSLAVTNSIEAVKAGAAFIDGTLQGIGRSVGNAQMEILVILLAKLGYKTGIDSLQIMDAGDLIVRPRMPHQTGIDSLSATLGDAQFHSSFLPIVEKVAKEYHLDVRKLILEISKVDRITVTEDLADTSASRLKGQE